MTDYNLYPVIATPLVIYMTGMFVYVMESLWTNGLSAPEGRRGERHYKYFLFISSKLLLRLISWFINIAKLWELFSIETHT